MDEDTTIEQDLEEICQKLRTERAQLQDRIKRDTTRIERLTWAINGIEGSATAAPVAPAPAPAERLPSVYEMALAAVEQFHNGATFDKQSLGGKIAVLYPTLDMLRVRRGIYGAVAALKKKGIIELAPGGYRAVRPVSQPA